MKKLPLLLIAVINVSFAFANKTTISGSKIFYVEKNNGQVIDQFFNQREDVFFIGKSGALSFFYTPEGLSYQLSTVVSNEQNISVTEDNRFETTQATVFSRVDLNWIDANTTQQISYELSHNSYHTYYNVGVNASPVHFIKKYSKAVVKNVWNGIDIVFYEKEGQLESDFLVAKAEDYQYIKWKIAGADVSIDEKTKSLIIKTPLGEIREGTLKVYQHGKLLSSKWLINEHNEISFSIEGFVAGEPMLIDPPVRLWGTYFGGTNDETSTKAVSDNNQNIYLAGYTSSLTNIATTGSHQDTIASNIDGFLSKFDTDGQLLWSTYYGGAGNDFVRNCVIDNNGDIYICGNTFSFQNIATPGIHSDSIAFLPQSTLQADAFLVKFNDAGQRIWGTYFGGTAEEIGNVCVTDASNNIYLAGSTGSNGNIAYGSSYQTVKKGVTNAFLAKFNSSGTVIWATYLGGSTEENATGCAIDSEENIYLTGNTSSFDFPADSNAHQQQLSGGNDIFLAKFDSTGAKLWLTLYGGSQNEIGGGCITDADDNIYFSGTTFSSDNIATTGSYQENNNGSAEMFLAKFTYNGMQVWATYYGGSDSESGNTLDADQDGNLLISGTTTGNNLNTLNCYQCSSGGNWDVFAAKFDTSGSLLNSTYFGGPGRETGSAIASNGFTYVYGRTQSNTDISTPGAHQTTRGGMWDGFIIKILDDDLPTNIANNETTTKLQLLVYPNPASNTITIDNMNKETTLRIYNLIGNLLNTIKATDKATIVSIENLPNGIYSIVASNESDIKHQLLVISR